MVFGVEKHDNYLKHPKPEQQICLKKIVNIYHGLTTL